jgi:hypothetical protein
MKKVAFWDVRLLCISSQRASVASYGYVPSSPIFVTLMMKVLSSSEKSVLTRATRRNVPEDAILHDCFGCPESDAMQFESYCCFAFLFSFLGWFEAGSS